MKTKNILKNYLSVIIGSFIIAAGFNMFFIPCRISSGGVSTLGTIFYYIFGVPLSVTNIAANAVLFVLGYKYVGRHAVVKTVIGILSLSIFLEMTKIFPAFGEDLVISAVIGGVFVGAGVGLVVRVDASTGGSDFGGIILKKFLPHIPIATLILSIDSIIIVIAGIVFESYMITFYSAVAMFIAAKVTDSVMMMGNAAKSVYIISAKSTEIAQMIMDSVNRGVTGIYSKGLYTGNENMMLLCAVSPKQLPRLINNVKEIDKDAFVIVADVKEVHGEGFIEN